MSTVTVENLELSQIIPSTTNPRKSFDQVALEQLAESIKEIGVTVPILVRPWPKHKPMSPPSATGRYELISGHRRLRAAKIAELETIPAFVRVIDDATALDIQMVENLQRADLHPMEEAAGYEALIEAAADRGVALTQEELAHKVGKPLSYVAQRVRLLEAIPVVRKTFVDGLINLGHVLILARLTPELQEKGLRQVFDPNGWKGKDRTIEELVDDLVAQTKPDPEYPLDAEENEHLPGVDTLATPVSKLKQWVETNVTLDLKTAPWNLADDMLVEEAGSCLRCEKRTGSNPALFAELTAAADACTDPDCFGKKKSAFVKITVKAAEKQGKPLVKLTSSYGNDKLDGTEKVIKQGQWVKAEEGSCPNVVQGLMTKGDETGSVISVCCNQKCKTHKHTVYEPYKPQRASEPKPPKGMSQEQFRAEKERESKRRTAEVKGLYLAIREAYANQVDDAEVIAQFIDRALDDENCDDHTLVLEINGWALAKNDWQKDLQILRDKTRALDGLEYRSFLFDLMYAELSDADTWRDPTKELTELAKQYGVNPVDVKQRVMDDNPELYDEPKPAEKPAPKKAAKKAMKKTPAKKAAKATGKSAAANDFTDEEVDKLATVLADTSDDEDLGDDDAPDACDLCGDADCHGECED
jgi:ParB family transcriptional regulator, chromosome partitioning protein